MMYLQRLYPLPVISYFPAILGRERFWRKIPMLWFGGLPSQSVSVRLPGNETKQ